MQYFSEGYTQCTLVRNNESKQSYVLNLWLERKLNQ